MKISELARAAGTSAETVRFYEKQGLLPPPHRADNNYRTYGEAHLERLRFIRNCRALDMSHDEIQALLQVVDQGTGCGAVTAVFDEHIGHVDARLAELQALRGRLLQLRAQCQGEHEAAADCGIVHQLADAPTQAPPRHSHLG